MDHQQVRERTDVLSKSVDKEKTTGFEEGLLKANFKEESTDNEKCAGCSSFQENQ